MRLLSVSALKGDIKGKYNGFGIVGLEAVLKRINQAPHNIRELVPDIDEQVAATIMRGLEPAPSDRWQSMLEMLMQFREARVRLKDPTLVQDQTDSVPTPRDDHADKWQFRTT